MRGNAKFTSTQTPTATLNNAGDSLRPIERKFEVYFYNFKNVELECRGSDFRVVERKCTVAMHSDNYGEIDC